MTTQPGHRTRDLLAAVCWLTITVLTLAAVLAARGSITW